ncbi:hypothetical protein ACQ86N_43805 [Puia sp. P3]|uniref:hypothetical protein n=1 Tax=Puia sp. P3 TaxID=3423952 RepID=UPI003D664850
MASGVTARYTIPLLKRLGGPLAQLLGRAGADGTLRPGRLDASQEQHYKEDI